MKINISDARTVSYKILFDVIENGAFSNISVNNHLNAIKNEIDRKLAVNIVYGTLKKRNRLEKILDTLSKSPVDQIDPRARIIILMSLYQILYLDKIPEYALVNDAVNMAKFHLNQGVGSFVNGVLRSAIRRKDELIVKEKALSEHLFYEYGFPVWFSKLIVKHYSKDYLVALAKEFNKSADVFVRVNTYVTTKEDLVKELEEIGVKCEDTYVPNTIKVIANQNLFSSVAYKSGHFFVQDLSGVISAYALGAKKGDRTIDLCSAPGAKSFNVGIMSEDSEVISCDVNTKKLEIVKRTAQQLGLKKLRTYKRDATKVYNDEQNKYDNVICDVPCSGMGVIKRKPEILFNLTEKHIKDTALLQRRILQSGVDYLKVGGTLIYSTCTINPDENQKNVEFILSENPSLELVEIKLPFELPTKHDEMKKGQLMLDPTRDGCDGFFMAKLTKKS